MEDANVQYSHISEKNGLRQSSGGGLRRPFGGPPPPPAGGAPRLRLVVRCRNTASGPWFAQRNATRTPSFRPDMYSFRMLLLSSLFAGRWTSASASQAGPANGPGKPQINVVESLGIIDHGSWRKAEDPVEEIMKYVKTVETISSCSVLAGWQAGLFSFKSFFFLRFFKTYYWH